MLQPFAMIFTLNVSYVNVRKVPLAAPYDARFSVRYRGNLASGKQKKMGEGDPTA
jgi:hypothetical protein